MRSSVTDQEPIGALFSILVFGLFVGLMVGGTACTHFEKWAWESRAIRHGAARYNEKTAVFEWVNPEVPDAK